MKIALINRKRILNLIYNPNKKIVTIGSTNGVTWICVQTLDHVRGSGKKVYIYSFTCYSFYGKCKVEYTKYENKPEDVIVGYINEIKESIKRGSE